MGDPAPSVVTVHRPISEPLRRPWLCRCSRCWARDSLFMCRCISAVRLAASGAADGVFLEVHGVFLVLAGLKRLGSLPA